VPIATIIPNPVDEALEQLRREARRVHGSDAMSASRIAAVAGQLLAYRALVRQARALRKAAAEVLRQSTGPDDELAQLSDEITDVVLRLMGRAEQLRGPDPRGALEDGAAALLATTWLAAGARSVAKQLDEVDP
jgi:hypothetical protein